VTVEVAQQRAYLSLAHSGLVVAQQRAYLPLLGATLSVAQQRAYVVLLDPNAGAALGYFGVRRGTARMQTIFRGSVRIGRVYAGSQLVYRRT